jgi:hypothetical protein
MRCFLATIGTPAVLALPAAAAWAASLPPGIQP